MSGYLLPDGQPAPWVAYQTLSEPPPPDPRVALDRLLTNSFCPTGPGGGIDPHCSPGSGASPHPSGDPDAGVTDHTPVYDKPVYRGGPANEGKFVTYHTTSRDVAESYEAMFKERFGEGAGASVHESKVTIASPAPYHVIEKEASKLGIDNGDYTPASVFDNNLHGDRQVQSLVTRLKSRGYDGAILEDIPYGRSDLGTIKAYVTFTGAKSAQTEAPGSKPVDVKKTLESQRLTSTGTGADKTDMIRSGSTRAPAHVVSPADKKKLAQHKKTLKELEQAERAGVLSDKTAPARYRQFILELEKKIAGNVSVDELREALRTAISRGQPR
jgi:hypothetical protein